MAIIRVAAASILILSLGGCVGDDCNWEPIGASIRAPIWAPPDADAAGQCGRWVKVEGLDWTQSQYAFDLDGEALEPIGEAEATSKNVSPLGAPTIYQIPGVAPDEAIAMEAANGTFLVFTKGAGGGGDLPPELCPMLAPEGNPNTDSCE